MAQNNYLNNGLIGETETMRSPSFIERMKQQKKETNDNQYKNCGTGKEWEWSEYKTSMLTAELNFNSVINFDLKIFMQKMIINLLSIIDIDLHTEIKNYIQVLPTMLKNLYKVPQSHVWSKLIPDEIPNEMWNDVYNLINFLKFLWIKFYDNQIAFDLKKPVTIYKTLIHFFQQQIFTVQSVIKGARFNDMSDKGYKSIYDGISIIESDDLKHRIKHNPHLEQYIEKWKHPGTQQCFVPHFGGYGNMIKVLRESPKPEYNFYGSLQCGPSGSVNYFFFMYLLSTITITDQHPHASMKRLILIFIMQLAADGGHNIREIIFGLTSTVIILRTIIEDVKQEIITILKTHNLTLSNKFSSNIKKLKQFIYVKKTFLNIEISDIFKNSNVLINLLIFIRKDISRDINDKQIVKLYFNILQVLMTWENPVNIFYDYTKDINIVGIDYNYLKDIIHNEKEKKDKYELCKQKLYNVMFGIEKWEHDKGLLKNISQSNDVQCFFALENDRYKHDLHKSFIQSADYIVTDIIKTLYCQGINDNINNRVNIKRNACNLKKSDTIPYA